MNRWTSKIVWVDTALSQCKIENEKLENIHSLPFYAVAKTFERWLELLKGHVNQNLLDSAMGDSVLEKSSLSANSSFADSAKLSWTARFTYNFMFTHPKIATIHRFFWFHFNPDNASETHSFA